MQTGTDIQSFMRVLSEHNRKISFHNLRFDGAFILDWLLKNDYRYTDARHLAAGQFKTLISDTGKFYSMSIRFYNGVSVEFVDSLKKLNMSVSRVAATFKLEEGKGELDYYKPRPIGYEPTPEEIDYLRRDVGIMARAMHTVYSEGLTKLTNSSDALTEYKASIGERAFNKFFPTLSYDMDAEIRRAYRGGFTHPDARFQLKKTGPGIVLDVNSLYPSVMYNELMPYGIPQWQDEIPELTERFPLSIFAVTITAKLKRNHIPCIQIKGSSMFSPAEYIREIKEPTTLVVTNVDWQLYQDHYDIDVLAYEGGWRFRAARGMFKAYIDKWSEIKARSVGGQREIAKIMLNGLYGKFGSNPNVTGKIPYLENDRVKYQTGEPERREPVYTAVAVFTTSYGRNICVRAAQANYPTFAYADTDSLHLLTERVPDTLEIHPTAMGAWKLEYGFSEALYVRAKAYLERLPDGSYVNRFAGVPERVSKLLTFDDIWDGNVLHGKLVPRSVPGGVVLVPSPYEIKL